MGSQPDPVVADSNIYYTGPLTHEKCLEVFSIADWMIHLAWADHSPNVVVEALSQGCPVICSETGGTQELVNGNGLVLKEDIKYNFELYDYNNPPTIDITQVTNLPNVIVNCPDLDIKNVANEYENLFLSVMNSNSCV
jgi:glycosyltransferase involved in cell wall biosynthesis